MKLCSETSTNLNGHIEARSGLGMLATLYIFFITNILTFNWQGIIVFERDESIAILLGESL